MLIQIGRVEEGLVIYQRALELDPLSLAISSDLGLGYFYARQYARAREQFQKTIALDPKFFRTYFYLARLEEQQGNYAGAIAHYQQGYVLFGESPERISALTDTLSKGLTTAGERGYWQQRLAIKLQNPQLRSEWECDLVGVYARLGEAERAFAELEKFRQGRIFDLLFLKIAPEFDGLRNDARYAELVRRIGLPQ